MITHESLNGSLAKNSFNFNTLPPPTNIVDMIVAQLDTLTDSQKQIIKFAST